MRREKVLKRCVGRGVNEVFGISLSKNLSSLTSTLKLKCWFYFYLMSSVNEGLYFYDLGRILTFFQKKIILVGFCQKGHIFVSRNKLTIKCFHFKVPIIQINCSKSN